MVQKCVVSGCTETDATSTLSFYSFPEDEHMKKRWLMAIRKNDTLLENTTICSKHFLPEGFYIDAHGNKYLKPDTVPSIFSIQDHYHEIEKIKEKLLKDRQTLTNVKKPRNSLILEEKPEKIKSHKSLEKQIIKPMKNVASTYEGGKDFIEEDKVRDKSENNYKIDFSDPGSSDLVDLPEEIINIQKKIAYQKYKHKRETRTLQQKLTRQNKRIRKQYDTIRDLCNQLSQLKRQNEGI